MKDFMITISVDMPFPREFKSRQKASDVAPAVSRALKDVRKSVGRKQIKTYRIEVVKI